MFAKLNRLCVKCALQGEQGIAGEPGEPGYPGDKVTFFFFTINFKPEKSTNSLKKNKVVIILTIYFVMTCISVVLYSLFAKVSSVF